MALMTKRKPLALSSMQVVGTPLPFNPFPDLVMTVMTSAFRADARLRARRRPGREPVDLVEL